jgi:hypothetical protein
MRTVIYQSNFSVAISFIETGFLFFLKLGQLYRNTLEMRP